MATRGYTVGKGKVMFNRDTAVLGVRAKGTGYADLGNAPGFQLTLNNEKLDHYSSRQGIQLKDLSIIIRAEAMGQFTLDEPNGDNLTLFFMSVVNDLRDQAMEASAHSLHGEGDNVGEVTVAALGMWYPLYASVAGTKTNSAVAANSQNTGTVTLPVLTGTQTANVSHSYTVQVAAVGAAITDIQLRTSVDGAPFGTAAALSGTGGFSTDLDGLSLDFIQTEQALFDVGDEWTFSVAVTATGTEKVYNLDSSGTYALTVQDSLANTLTIGETGHVQVDYAAGLIYVNPVQPGTNPISANDVLTVTGGWAGLADISLKQAFTTTTIKGHLYFVGAPPQGQIIDVKGYCSITPTGDFQLIQENTWQQFQFNIEFIKDPDGNYGDGLLEIINRGQVG